jgi:hypothetical protein
MGNHENKIPKLLKVRLSRMLLAIRLNSRRAGIQGVFGLDPRPIRRRSGRGEPSRATTKTFGGDDDIQDEALLSTGSHDPGSAAASGSRKLM